MANKLIQFSKWVIISGIVICVLFFGYIVIHAIMKAPDTDYNGTKVKDSEVSSVTKVTDQNKTIDKNSLSYYPTIEEATAQGSFNNEEYNNKKIKEEILLLQDEENAIFFFKADWKEGEKGDAVAEYKFAIKKDVNGNNLYSEPTDVAQVTWQKVKETNRDAGLNYADQVRMDINLNNASQVFNLNPETTKLEWGLLDTKKVFNMTINSQTPTKIIPVKLDGEQVYFWYYENLQLDSVEKADIKFN